MYEAPVVVGEVTDGHLSVVDFLPSQINSLLLLAAAGRCFSVFHKRITAAVIKTRSLSFFFFSFAF
jgi:hypothetical protein